MGNHFFVEKIEMYLNPSQCIIKMVCNAILLSETGVVNGNLCTAPCIEGSLFCSDHQMMTNEEHKRRWIDLFILGRHQDPFLYKYNEENKSRILGDLEQKIITLSQEDILEIPSSGEFIDIYILLMEYGYIGLDENCHPDLFWASLQYLAHIMTSASDISRMYQPVLSQKVRDILLLRNQDHLYFFFSMIAGFALFRGFKGNRFEDRIPVFKTFLESLLASEVGKSLLWDPFPDRLLKVYQTIQEGKPSNPVVDFMKSHFLPHCKQLYKEEKAKQKARTNLFKEELMMICWHPDRFIDYCLDEEEKAEIKSLP